MFADLTIAGFSSEITALSISNGATVTLVGCSVLDNRITGTQLDDAVISVEAVDPDNTFSQQQDTILRLQQCSFGDNDSDHVLVSESGSAIHSEYEAFIFSDVSREVHQYIAEDILLTSTQPLVDAPISRPGITATSSWFVTTQEVCCLRAYLCHLAAMWHRFCRSFV